MSKEKTLLEKIKSILDLPITEKKEEIKIEVKAAADDAPAETPTQEPEATDGNETDVESTLETLAAAIADLQSRVANLESEVSLEKEAAVKMEKIVKLMAEQPTGTPPKKTTPYDYVAIKTQENKTYHDNRLAELNKIFNEVKANDSTLIATQNKKVIATEPASKPRSKFSLLK